MAIPRGVAIFYAFSRIDNDLQMKNRIVLDFQDTLLIPLNVFFVFLHFQNCAKVMEYYCKLLIINKIVSIGGG